jgi:polyphosphate kinase
MPTTSSTSKLDPIKKPGPKKKPAAEKAGTRRAKMSADTSTAAAQQPTAATTSLDSPELYINRELSLLDFQQRVLEEAADSSNPLLERVKFLSIFGSNMDEFFMVRVALLCQQIDSNKPEVSVDGKGPSEQLEMIRHCVNSLMGESYGLWGNQLMPALKKAGIHILELNELNPGQKIYLDDYFRRAVYPVLTPLAVDPSRPFPHISNLSLNVAAIVTNGDGNERFARIKVPDSLPQLLPVPGEPGETCFVWLEHVIMDNLRMLFPDMEMVDSSLFHVTRDAELAIQEVEMDDLLESIQEAVWRRRFRDAVRLQVSWGMNQKWVDLLTTNLELSPEDVYRVHGPIALSRVRGLLSLDRPALKDKPFTPSIPAGFSFAAKSEIFSMIQQSDILVHHPYESFQPVVDFLRVAARDPDVLAIKMTLYRAGSRSPIVDALLDAIQNGKQVAALVELKARFDEESNIEWAEKLEAEGVHVVYGLLGLKVHCKVALVVRREGDQIRRYCHLGTGNYNATTGRLYTDLGMFTCDEEIGEDVTDLFNHLTGYSAKKQYRKLLVAPHSLRPGLERLIQREVHRQKQHGDGYMILKMNALEDKGMIEHLYAASQAGVKIDCIVRGVCSLRPGIPGLSDNIRVKSIIGRFLEHSRIYYFRNGGEEEIYLGSADFMIRNLSRRVETLFPVGNPKILRRLRDEVLEQYLKDEAGARHLQADGTYTRVPKEPNKRQPDSQAWFLKHHSV